ncbi:MULTISPECIES: hypothetical protein [unclassified Caballeronia]|uniref:hypothetical protein n=1 Tax=unclassified Caballeronia TaxID=2646786 RepID=UPI002855A447|nr:MULTISPECIES: hypothetical protein [unclassified Caballeronia]MDR5741437.1 hypothetical protein [Caballeronia sp. LZ016]MDR5806750.1 hypothetical protein [Caballeronia sp. LZ019]
MLTWPALLFAPSLLLGLLSVNYALVEPSCHLQSMALLNGVSASSLAISVVCTALAFARWRAARREADPSAPGLTSRPGFIAAVATGVGALSSLAIFVISLPQWLLSAC